jgi:PAS domain S-box-containing protein
MNVRAKTNQKLIKENALVNQNVQHLKKSKAERILEERALRLSEQQLQPFFDSAGDAIYILQTDTGRILNCNSRACLDLGYSRDELVKMYATDIESKLSAGDVDKVHRDMKLGAVITVEGMHKRKDGSLFPVEIRCTLLSVAQPGLMIAIARDITSRKRAEEALRQSEERYRSLASVADRVFVVDKDCRHLFANDAYLDTFGPERDSVIGRRYDEFNDEKLSRLFADAVRDVFETGNIYEYEFRGGRTGVDFLRRISPIRSIEGGISAVTVISVNITDLKRRDEELILKTTNLEEVNAALKVLIKQVEEGKTDLQGTILSNVRELVLPYLMRLKNTPLSDFQKAILQTAELNLDNITSTFLKALKMKFYHLTPRESEVAILVREGKGAKEIADMLCLSEKTIKLHRSSLRAKLGLRNKKINLRSYLLAIQ